MNNNAAARTVDLLAVLGLPKGSLLTLDGCPIQIQRDDFVGFTGFSSCLNDGNEFHWLTIRPAVTASASSKKSPRAEYASIASGFYIPIPKQQQDLSRINALVLRYDPQTEEVALETDETTQANLLEQLHNQTIHPERILFYDQVCYLESNRKSWNEMTQNISCGLLVKRGIGAGAKIVPGSCRGVDDSEDDPSMMPFHTDGSSVKYPGNIPVLVESASRRTTHAGTKRFLVSLSPPQRTALFLTECPADAALEHLLHHDYQGSWKDLLGDIQLSYQMFVQINCYPSLEHWRDLVALVSHVSPNTMAQHVDLYESVLVTLSCQMQTMDREFFEEAAGADDGGNFLKPALQNFTQNLSNILTDSPRLSNRTKALQDMLEARVPSLFREEQETETTSIDALKRKANTINTGDDIDSEDGPVVVGSQEIEAFMARSSNVDGRNHSVPIAGEENFGNTEFRSRFPILAAAIQPYEDVLMTCARALDDPTDVSLVREAAAYLEEVEANKRL